MNSSPPKHMEEPTLPPPATPSALAGMKRPAPTLLPPFEPLSSSPGLPRPAKRQATGDGAYSKYPTPLPTSSTGILSSSPPGAQRSRARTTGGAYLSAGGALSSSTLSERTPLSAVPTVVLNANGETLLMGRSSHSSNYQLSSNRLVSRVHVRARYIPAASPLEPNRIEVVCGGWNGLKLHCQGRTYELWKGDSFTSETEGTEMMLDVQDTRVMIQWPSSRRRGPSPTASDAPSSPSLWGADSPTRLRGAAAGGAGAGAAAAMMTTPGFLQSSPIRRPTRIASPVSPTPANLSSSRRLQMLLPAGERDDAESVDIYVDPSADEDDGEGGVVKDSIEGRVGGGGGGLDPNASHTTEETNSFSSDLSDLEDEEEEGGDEYGNYPDEENDPVVHSFGPFGANLSDRLASITASSPKVNRSPNRRALLSTAREAGATGTENAGLRSAAAEAARAKAKAAAPPPFVNPVISNHMVNQLAYSRLSSTPLSAMMQNLPAGERGTATREQLQSLIEATPCIGVIERQGKDAAGKPLESEYYYIPEHDCDAERRAAVVDGLRKPSLRACRKQHKQYYWKKPRTP